MKKILALLMPILVVGGLFFSFIFLAGGTFETEVVGTGNGEGEWVFPSLGEKDLPKPYISVYKEAGEAYEIDWELIAAFHKVETNFGTSPSMESSAGAIGHFQFLPETWLGWGYGMGPPKEVYTDPKQIEKYGGYGVDATGDNVADPYKLKDAAFACANYVKAHGGMGNLRNAIFAYNHADWYVDLIMKYYGYYRANDYTLVEGIQTGGGGSGNSSSSMVQVAMSQLGSQNDGGQKFWSWYGWSYRVEWCATFVSWVGNETGTVFPKFAYCPTGINNFKASDQWLNGGNTPKEGNVIFFDWEGDGVSDHVGIVKEVKNNIVYTIEGNSGDVVAERQYAVSSSLIVGYGTP